uniref:Uncharacterized protein n=1 Tax=Populus trichocarpa TaxID=3694 RepID=A0A3N7G9E6_POPTR
MGKRRRCKAGGVCRWRPVCGLGDRLLLLCFGWQIGSVREELLGWLLPLGGCSAAEEGLLLAGEGRRRCWNRLEKEETEGRGDRSLFFLEEMERRPLVFSLRRKGDGGTD